MITGTITPASLQIVLDQLFFESNLKSTVSPKVTILDSFELRQEITRILSFPTYSPHTYFLTGSPISRRTLIDLKVEKYDSVLILADKNAANKEEEDSKNILKYWSIKNYCVSLKIYIEILTENLKKTIMSMPNPHYITSDNVVCVEELRSLFFSQNCIYPGIKNVFFTIS